MRRLAWRHRGWLAREWDLVEDERVLATLRQRGLGFNAELRIGERSFRLDRSGLLRWTLNVRDEGGAPIASMRLGWRGQGEPTLQDGRRFAWHAESWWGTRWTLADPERGARVAGVEMGSFLKMGARVEVEDGAPRDEALVPLLALTWLAVVMTTQGAASAGGG